MVLDSSSDGSEEGIFTSTLSELSGKSMQGYQTRDVTVELLFVSNNHGKGGPEGLQALHSKSDKYGSGEQNAKCILELQDKFALRRYIDVPFPPENDSLEAGFVNLL